MFESTATWMEEKVFPDIDDYHQYIGPWAQLSTMPITRFDREHGDKVYGSAVFNRWLDDEYDESIVRRAWELSINQGSFAPGAYDKAIREGHGPGFSYELANFAASTAEWKAAGSGVHEGAAFPDVKRAGVTLPTDGSTLTGKLDHTAYALFDVAPRRARRSSSSRARCRPAPRARSCSSAARRRPGLQDHRGRRPHGRHGHGQARQPRPLRADHGGRRQRQLRQVGLERQRLELDARPAADQPRRHGAHGRAAPARATRPAVDRSARARRLGRRRRLDGRRRLDRRRPGRRRRLDRRRRSTGGTAPRC